jgi:6-pyruvoyl-tetrahydropterin synthase/tetratricopeptide (TPR) repeat protein
MTIQYITRKGSFDSAHRLMNERVKCFSIHGHTYLYELTFVFQRAQPIGYAIDFKEIRRVGATWIDDTLDHGAILNPKDADFKAAAIATGSKLRLMSLNGPGEYCNPTVENVAKEIFLAMEVLFADWVDLRIHRVRLYETPVLSAASSKQSAATLQSRYRRSKISSTQSPEEKEATLMDELYRTAWRAFDRHDFECCAASCDRILSQNPHPEGPALESILGAIYLLLLIHEVTSGTPAPDSLTRWSQRALFDLFDPLPLRLELLNIFVKIQISRGRYLSCTHSAMGAIHAMRKAVEWASGSRDPVVRALALAQLGHKTMKTDLRGGGALAQAACELVDLSALDGDSSLEYRRQLDAIRAIRGIYEFDLGHYQTAMKYLIPFHTSAWALGIKADIAVACNYLSQVHLALGEYEQAEQHLLKAIDCFGPEAPSQAWNANNRALLGKVYLEWNRVEAAQEPLVTGWQESCTARSLPLITLVRNYYAEYLMCAGKDRAGEWETLAENLLQENLVEAGRAAIYRSQILSASLLGQLSLARGDQASAGRYSDAAVDLLADKGWLPALRTQEIFYHGYRVQEACGNEDRAQQMLAKAREVVSGIAERIGDPDQRASFLTRVKVNSDIMLRSSPSRTHWDELAIPGMPRIPCDS